MKKNIIAVGMFICLLCLNGCGKKEDSKKPETQSGKEQTSTVNTQTPDKNSSGITQPAGKEESKLASMGTAADFSLPKLDGSTLKLSDFKGKVVILDFWATWCPPCRKMIPELEKVYEKLKGSGVEIIGISLDEGPVESVKSFVSNVKITYNIVLGNKETSKSYGQINAIPTSFIIDQSGNIRDKHIGYRTQEEMEQVINQLLNEQK